MIQAWELGFNHFERSSCTLATTLSSFSSFFSAKIVEYDGVVDEIIDVIVLAIMCWLFWENWNFPKIKEKTIINGKCVSVYSL